MLYDVGLGGPSDEERYRASLHRIADVLGCAVGDLMNPDAMKGELAQTAELLRLWHQAEADTREAVLQHLRITVRSAEC